MTEWPQAWLEQTRELLGGELDQLLRQLQAPAPISLRINPDKERRLPYPGTPVPWHPEGFYLEERPAFVLDPLFHAGAYYVQEASSMILYEALRQWLPAEQPVRALDLAAAPGGKTTLLASALPSGSLLLANEVIRSRFATLRENMTRWGQHVHLANHDPKDFRPLQGFFDLLLVDAPCSGEGLFRKDPQSIGHWSAEAVVHCSLRQRRILEEAVHLLRPGGLLIYSTCTFNPRENEQQGAWLQKTFGLRPLSLDLPAAWGVAAREVGYQLWPHRLRGEGFYFAGFSKAGHSASSSFGAGRFNRLRPLARSRQTIIQSWLSDPDDLLLLETSGGMVRSLPAEQGEACAQLESALPRLWLGREVGQFKGKDFIPAHELALGLALSSKVPSAELDEENALRFLRREALSEQAIERGWQVARYRGLGLGWLKGLGRRANNYLPASWRIRTSRTA